MDQEVDTGQAKLATVYRCVNGSLKLALSFGFILALISSTFFSVIVLNNS
jgi:hypothetical protein